MDEDIEKRVQRLEVRQAVHEDRWKAYFRWREKADELLGTVVVSKTKLGIALGLAAFTASLLASWLMGQVGG